MSWWLTLGAAFALLMVLFAVGLPIFVAFLLVNVAGVLVFLGPSGFGLFANSIVETASDDSLLAVPFFILMGEILFRGGAMSVLYDSLDVLLRRVRGRLYFLAVSMSTILGALSGSSMGVAALLGRSLYPGMVVRNYERELSAGLILAGATLAPIIPPSVLAIILGTLANVSIVELLIAGVGPGLFLGCVFVGYLVIRLWLNPSLAPTEVAVVQPGAGERGVAVAMWRIAPLSFVIFMVMGLIMLGVATPSEAAATGVLGALLVGLGYRTTNLRTLGDAVMATARITSMVIVIVASSKMFGQLLSITGATGELVQSIAALDLGRWIVFATMMAVVFVICMFLDQIALMLIAVPIYAPVVQQFGFDPIWFWMIFLINISVGGITPPFGYAMFVFKGTVPDMPLAEVYRAAWPFVALIVAGTAVMCVVPEIVLFLPRL